MEEPFRFPTDLSNLKKVRKLGRIVLRFGKFVQNFLEGAEIEKKGTYYLSDDEKQIIGER